MKKRDSDYFGKYEINENIDTSSKQKLKKYYDEFKMILADKKKTKLLALSIKKLLT